MPNTFAFVALLGWPLVTLLLFAFLPARAALVWSIIAGFLALPTGVGLNFPFIPVIDKTLVPSVSAALMCWIAAGRQKVASSPGGADEALTPSASPGFRKWVIVGLLLMLIVTPFFTAMHNAAPVIAGPRVIPGLRLHDALSIAVSLIVVFTPYLLAQRFLATAEAHRLLLVILVLSALGYSLLVLVEVRLSPQLSKWVYGFFPHSFAQHIRGDGFRPVVFLQHGLALGIFLAMAVLAACALWRQALNDGGSATGWSVAAIWLMITLVLSRNLGATALAFLFAPLILFAPRRLQITVTGVVAAAVLLFPMLRGAGWVPTEMISAAAEAVNPERAGSLRFRFIHEDLLLDRANQKPLAGWGSWGRNRVFDPETGEDLSVTDGYWVIVIGSMGWIGYLARFGLMTLPIIMIAFMRGKTFQPVTLGLMAIAAVGLIDLIPNAMRSPVLLMVFGALAGLCTRERTIADFQKNEMFLKTKVQNVPDLLNASPVAINKPLQHVRKQRN